MSHPANSNEEIDNVRRLGVTTLLENSGNRINDEGRTESVQLVATFYPALNSFGEDARRLHPMLKNLEEHRNVFREPPVIAFRRCKNLKGMLLGPDGVMRDMGELIRGDGLVVVNLVVNCVMY